MNPLRLEAVVVKGYASIRDARVQMGDLNVLVGANGSGKSNFVSALELLGRIVDQRLQAFVRERGGASQVLHDPRVHAVELTIQSTRADYHAMLVDTDDDRLAFAEEVVSHRPDPRRGPTSSVLDRDHQETALHRRSGQPDAVGPVAREVIALLRGCRVYHFHDTSSRAPVRRAVSTADNLALAPDASNLAAMLRMLRDRAPATYRQIVGTIRLAAPFFGDFVLEPEGPSDTVRLRWQHVASDRVFSAHQLSDGTLRFISLATLLLDTDRLPSLVVLDEPELGLHPFAIVQLAEMLRAASVSSQVVVATQSVTLIDHIDLADLIVVERDHGTSTFTRPPTDRLRDWLDEYSVGDLWQKALIGGRPARETR